MLIILLYCLQIRLHEIYETTTHIYMVLELVTGGELFERLVLCRKKGKMCHKIDSKMLEEPKINLLPQENVF